MKFNYKKSLLSVAAATALTVTSLSANYIPLTDISGNEEEWVLFGVTGLKTTGAGSGTSAGTFSITDSTANVAEDLTQDDLFTEGMVVSSNSLGKVKVLAPYSSVEVRVDTTGATFNETEPVRTMYVTMTEGGAPSFAFTYRASLEGQTMQYSTNSDGSDAHTITIKSEYTYNNPGFGEVIQEIAGLPGSSLSNLSDAVDYNFEDNPIDSAYYSKTTHQDPAAAGEYLRVYSYDANLEQWKLYDSRNTDDANDFLTLEKGKAYWAKMNNPANKVGGLVLGSSSVSATEYAAAGITDGWNLMAFDNENPDIRKSTTGLIVTLTAAANVAIDIYDTSGNHKITPTIDAADEEASCRAINQAIKTAKAQGSFPKDFDLRAYPTGVATEIALLSNKRFFLRDPNSGIDDVVTLAGKNPYTVTSTAGVNNTLDLNSADDTNGITDLANAGTSAAMSKYGEYAMVIKSIYASTGAGSGAGKIHVQSAADDATAVNAVAVGANIAATNTALDGLDIGGGTYTSVTDELDLNLDGTTDSVIIASTKPFYVRDHTFTRVFAFGNASTAGDAYIKGTGADATVSLNVANAAAAAFDGNGNVVSDVDADGNVVIITDTADANEFTITEATTNDHLTDAISTDDMAKGAVKGVFSLSNLSTASLTNTLVGDGIDAQDDTTDTLAVSITTLNGTFTLAADDIGNIITLAATPAVTVAEFASAIETQIKVLLDAENIQYTSVAATAADPSIITIVSTEITSFTISGVTVGGTAADDDTTVDAAASKIGVTNPTADLASDLKFNAVYTPNYVTDGPLYTMKDAGFALKALVTGSTDLTDGKVNWDSVDLTRTPADWLDSQDYNLFQVHESAGYWAFLEADAAANPLSISNAVLKPLTYTYRFNAKNAAGDEATNYNSVSGNIALTVEGLDTDVRAVPVVSATVAGSTVELANVAGSNIYTGKLSSYEIEDVSAGYEYEVLANVADGLGNNLISQDVGLKLDLQKPNTPTIDLTDPTAAVFNSTSTDVAGYYVFNGQIPEVDTAISSTLLAKLTSAEASAYGLCGKVDALAWNDAAYELNVIALDGLGTLGNGNASNTAIKSYVPLLQSSVLVTNTFSNATATVSGPLDGITHDANCADTGAQTVNYRMAVSSQTEFETAKLAYTPKNVADGLATIISLYVTGTVNAGSKVARIDYADAYAGEKVYIEVGSAVYSLILPSAAEIADARYTGADEGSTKDNPLDLDDATVAPNNVKATFYTGQNL